MNDYTFLKDDLFFQIKALHQIRQDHWEDPVVRNLLSCFMNILRAIYKTLDRMEVYDTEILPKYVKIGESMANRSAGKKFKEFVSIHS